MRCAISEGFAPGRLYAAAVAEMARRKQEDHDQRIARLKAMRRVVDRILQCHSLGMAEAGARRISGGTAFDKSLLWYSVAAAGEIAGCFAFWAWLRLGRVTLDAPRSSFACYLRTGSDASMQRLRAKLTAAYGGIYILVFFAMAVGCREDTPRPMGCHRRGHIAISWLLSFSLGRANLETFFGRAAVKRDNAITYAMDASE